MLGPQFLLRGQWKVPALIHISHKDAALYGAIGERGWLDTVDHLGVHGLGL
jgi:hypothetical protein